MGCKLEIFKAFKLKIRDNLESLMNDQNEDSLLIQFFHGPQNNHEVANNKILF